MSHPAHEKLLAAKLRLRCPDHPRSKATVSVTYLDGTRTFRCDVCRELLS